MREARCSWLPANQPGEIEDRGVHLWFAELNGPTNAMYGVLSAEERERAARFLAPIDRDRFVLARGLLRTLLSGYRHCSPQSLRFAYNAYGKPFLPEVPDTEPLQFNLSHSKDVLLLGITRRRRIGVDVERVDTQIDCHRLAKRFYSAAEYERWDALSASEKGDAWFRSWAVKEAYLKAVGVGLTEMFNPVEVSDAARWQTQTIIPCADFVGALAVEGGESLKVSRYCWQCL